MEERVYRWVQFGFNAESVMRSSGATAKPGAGASDPS